MRMNCDEKDALLIFLLVLTGVLTAAFAAVLFLFCRRKVRSQNGRCWLLEPKTVSHCMQCCGGSVKATTKVEERGECEILGQPNKRNYDFTKWSSGFKTCGDSRNADHFSKQHIRNHFCIFWNQHSHLVIFRLSECG